MDENLVKVIVESTRQRFRCFGGGRGSAFNPLAEMLKDERPMFAAGVDVEEVVRHVLFMANAAQATGKGHKRPVRSTP